jgi:hypothetical protein
MGVKLDRQHHEKVRFYIYENTHTKQPFNGKSSRTTQLANVAIIHPRDSNITIDRKYFIIVFA